MPQLSADFARRSAPKYAKIYIRKAYVLDSLTALERVMGIEPTRPAWKAGILPLNYTRLWCVSKLPYNHTTKGGALSRVNLKKVRFFCKSAPFVLFGLFFERGTCQKRLGVLK